MTKSFDEYSLDAASEFLQTAVFIDDNIYEKPTVVARPVARKKRNKSKKGEKEEGEPKQPKEDNVSNADDEVFDSYDIVNSFAKKQIVCSLYQPKKGAKVSPKSDIFPLCKASDLVIVDWDLYGDDGEKARELIKGLITQAVNDLPEQLRLIIIYTLESDLFGKLNEVYEKLPDELKELVVAPSDDDELAFHANNIRVKIFGKPSKFRPKEAEKHVIKEKDLPDAAINEFTKLASGLLQSTTLKGLAAIRNNSRKILSKFNRDLDPAFVTHYVLSPPEEEPSAHIIPLLMDEIEAVLEDTLDQPVLSTKVLEDWCKNHWIKGTHLANIFKGVDINTEVPKLIESRPSAGNESFGKLDSRNKVRKYAKIFSAKEENIHDHEFAYLMSVRTHYDDAPKVLMLGTILLDVAEEEYLLCLQPLCDSVRLNGSQEFIFTRLNKNGEISNRTRTSHIVFDDASTPVELYFEAKAFLSKVYTFESDSTLKKVIGKSGENNKTVFTGSDKEFQWICQLKMEHAQRAVEKIGSNLTRVGLTESEWLRRLG